MKGNLLRLVDVDSSRENRTPHKIIILEQTGADLQGLVAFIMYMWLSLTEVASIS
jgi:hypothetical protein